MTLDMIFDLSVWGSLLVICALSFVHLTIHRWRFLQGPAATHWLSFSAGTALAYVFAYLMPKLATIQVKLAPVADASEGFLRQHAYLLALAGLVTFFGLNRYTSTGPSEMANPHVFNNRVVLLQLIGYSLYSAQLGYLVTELSQPGFASYTLVAVILSLHLMGINHHLHHRSPIAYLKMLRYAYTVALFCGWLAGVMTANVGLFIMLTTTFVAGGIIITALREELPREGESHSIAFYLSIVLSTAAILFAQSMQQA